MRRVVTLAALAVLVAGPASYAAPAQPPRPPSAIFPLQQVWQLSVPATLAAAPGFDDRQAYVPAVNGELTAYTLSTGHVRWCVVLPTKIPPVAGNGAVFVATERALVALRADDGREVWRQTLAQPVSSALTWDNGWLVAGTADGELHVWRAVDGAPMWHVSVGARLSAPASIGGTTVYVPLADGRLLALDLTSGHPIWTDRLGGAPAGILPLDQWLFVGSGDNFFYCLNARTGEQRWRWRTGDDIIGAPIVDTERVYFVSLDGMLRALQRGSGRLAWQSALPIRPATGPMFAGPSVLVAGVDPTIPGYRTEDGQAESGVRMGEELAAPPHVMPWGFTLGPTLIVVTRSLSGAPLIRALARSLEPPLGPLTELPGTKLTGH